MDGAELVALHRNRFWQTEDGLQARQRRCFRRRREALVRVEDGRQWLTPDAAPTRSGVPVRRVALPLRRHVNGRRSDCADRLEFLASLHPHQ
jgi:hypothetical protein